VIAVGNTSSSTTIGDVLALVGDGQVVAEPLNSPAVKILPPRVKDACPGVLLLSSFCILERDDGERSSVD
jgi:hypothetical protein